MPLGHSVPVYENMHTSLQTDRKRATQNEKYAHMQMFPGTLRAGTSSSTPLEAQNTEDREKGTLRLDKRPQYLHCILHLGI